MHLPIEIIVTVGGAFLLIGRRAELIGGRFHVGAWGCRLFLLADASPVQQSRASTTGATGAGELDFPSIGADTPDEIA